jgi:hypothetical protein
VIPIVFKDQRKTKYLKHQEEKESKISTDENKDVTHKPGLYWSIALWVIVKRRTSILQ